MGRTAQTTGRSALSLEEIQKELRGEYGRITPARMVELFEMLPSTGVTGSSAQIIRELRGPLPDDE
jgi:hypothetical protein